MLVEEPLDGNGVNKTATSPRRSRRRETRRELETAELKGRLQGVGRLSDGRKDRDPSEVSS
jgi:hypothetical protein